MSINTFETFIYELYQSTNFAEIARITGFSNHKALNLETIRMMAISCFKTKNTTKCIELSEYFNEKSDIKDFFIFEILAECYFLQNDLVKSLENYEKALLLNPKLISARFKHMCLKYRLFNELDSTTFSKYEIESQQKKKISNLRIIAYIQLKEKKYFKAYNNLKLLIELNKSPFYPDYLSIIHAIENLEYSKQSQNTKKELTEYIKISKAIALKSEFVCNGSNNLFVTLSPATGFVLKKYNYPADKLCFIDNTNTYYTFAYELIAEHIISLVKKYKYENISIIGSSKGGTATIILLNLLQTALPNTTICAVSCSPQIQIFPFNKNLTIPSYQKFAEYFSYNSILESKCAQAQKLINFDILYRNKLTIFYGDKFKMDAQEVSTIRPINNTTIIPLNYSGHGSLIPLTILENKSFDELKQKYSKLEIDTDFQALGGNNLSSIVDEIFEIYSNPDMRLHKFLC